MPEIQTSLSDEEIAAFRAFIQGSEILRTEVEITPAEMLALFTTAKELVPSPGTRYVNEFISALLILDYVSADYATAGILGVYENTISGTVVSDTVAAAAFLQASADAIHVLQVLSATTALTAGNALVLACSAANPTAGDSPVRVQTAYRVHATGL